MKIGPIDTGQRVLVIAEIGVNHDGSVDRAAELVRHAKEAGADAVKLQVFAAERLMNRSARFADYQVGRTQADDPVAMLKLYELSDDALRTIAREADMAGIMMIATPFSPEDVQRVTSIGASAIKIASPDLVNMLLLQRTCEAGLPLIVSTGAATAAEIEASIQWLRTRTTDFALLHCISSYPTAADDANLVWIDELSRFGVTAGYSDHTDQLLAGAFAVAAGARIVEKHLTYDTSAAGPDHSASFEPREFGEYVAMIRLAERMRGTAGRRVLMCEEDVRAVSRQGLVAKRDIRGRAIVVDDLTTQRPGPGVSQTLLDSVIGQTPKHDIAAGQFIEADDVA
jgi:N,N'-diacetyllegionaminate synthase